VEAIAVSQMNLRWFRRAVLTCIEPTGGIGCVMTRPLRKPPKKGVASSMM